jgi:hypothetical protein
VELNTTKKKKTAKKRLRNNEEKREVRTETTIQKLPDRGRQTIMKDWLHRVD